MRPTQLKHADDLDRAAHILRSAFVRGRLTPKEILTIKVIGTSFHRLANRLTADLVADAKNEGER